ADTMYGRNHERSLAITAPSSELYETTTTLWTVDMQANGPIAQLPGGAARAAIGVNFRRDGYSSIPGSLGKGTPAVDFGRSVKAYFVEVRVPVVGDGNQ